MGSTVSLSTLPSPTRSPLINMFAPSRLLTQPFTPRAVNPPTTITPPSLSTLNALRTSQLPTRVVISSVSTELPSACTRTSANSTFPPTGMAHGLFSTVKTPHTHPPTTQASALPSRSTRPLSSAPSESGLLTTSPSMMASPLTTTPTSRTPSLLIATLTFCQGPQHLRDGRIHQRTQN